MKDTYTALMGIYTKDKYELIFDVKNGKKTIQDFEEDVKAFIKEFYPTEEDVDSVVTELTTNLFGYSVIEPLLKDNSISDIKVYDWNNIWYKKKGIYYKSDLKFESFDHYNRFVDTIKTRNAVNSSIANAIVKFADTETSEIFTERFTLFHGVLTQDGKPKVVIRKFPKRPYTTEEMINMNVLTPEIADYLKEAWNKGGILICGAPSGGKSTTLNWLKEFIPCEYGTFIVQESDLLVPSKEGENVLYLHQFDGGVESAVQYHLGELTRAGLTSDIRYIIIEETKDKEARYLLNASYTGLICGTTLHSNSSEQGIDKMVDYALMGDSDYSKRELLEMFASGFKTIVFLKDFKVTEISEVVDYNEKTGKIEYEPIFRLSVPKKKN